MASDTTAASSGPIQVGVLGCGYWGPNLIRNFETCSQTNVRLICDLDEGSLARGAKLAPQAEAVSDVDYVLQHPEIQAVAIATPVHTHVPFAKAAMESGKHVLVEKPMATSVAEAEQLVDMAKQRDLTLMVDHTFVYSPAIRKIKEFIDSGELGDLFYIDSVRINLGLFQNDINVLWDLAPHDVSIIDHLVGSLPRSLSSTGASHTASDLEDVAYLNVDFGDSLIATFHVNWLSPIKIRHLIIGGSKKSLVYNDLDPFEPIKVYNSGISVSEATDSRHGILISYRTGDTFSPYLAREEPLQNMVQHFAECIRERKPSLSDGEAGLRVVRILEAAQRSIKAQGGRITL